MWLLTGRSSQNSGSFADLPFEQDDYVLIAQFENLTGESLFDDGTLEAVLRRALSDSGFLHVAPAERIEDALRLMSRPLDTAVDRTVGQEIALRDGEIRVVLAGAVEKSDSGYQLTLQLVAAGNGRVLAGVREQDLDRAAIIPAIHRQASRVREQLGEALSLIEASEERIRKPHRGGWPE